LKKKDYSSDRTKGNIGPGPFKYFEQFNL